MAQLALRTRKLHSPIRRHRITIIINHIIIVSISIVKIIIRNIRISIIIIVILTQIYPQILSTILILILLSITHLSQKSLSSQIASINVHILSSMGRNVQKIIPSLLYRSLSKILLLIII